MSRPTQVSMQDIAKAAGVSPQTVSRVANGSDAVKPETRQRVEAAMERSVLIYNVKNFHTSKFSVSQLLQA